MKLVEIFHEVGRLRDTIWSRSDISIKFVRLYNALLRPLAIYASETWTLLELDQRKLEFFEMRCLGNPRRHYVRQDEKRTHTQTIEH
jgi:hypothetical protein